MTTDIAAAVINKLTTYCEQNNIVLVIDTTTSVSQLELDSLAFMEIVYELEEELAIVLDSADLGEMKTVADLIAVINRARKSAA